MTENSEEAPATDRGPSNRYQAGTHGTAPVPEEASEREARKARMREELGERMRQKMRADIRVETLYAMEAGDPEPEETEESLTYGEFLRSTPDELLAREFKRRALEVIYTADEWALRAELGRRNARREADRIEAEREKGAVKPYDVGTLADNLARPPEPPARVEGLIPWQASTAVIAQRKTGKTTLVLNLARCYLTGEPFLGRFPVREVKGRVAVLNFEVSGHTVAAWADEAGVPADRLVLVNLRGAPNPFANPARAAELAGLLREYEVEALVVDPFGRAFPGESQNDAGAVQSWLVQLDSFAREEVGALDVVLTVHAGWNGEHARGSSALEDWADSLIYLTRDEETGDRYVRADGRDVGLDEDKLLFDSTTRLLSLSGQGNRKAAKASRKETELMLAVADIVAEKPGLNRSELEAELRAAGHAMQKGDATRGAVAAEKAGLIYVEVGARNVKRHYVVKSPLEELDEADNPSDSSYPSYPAVTPGAPASSYPSPPIGAGVTGARTGDRRKVS